MLILFGGYYRYCLLQTRNDQVRSYEYVVRIINPAKKGKYINRTWHDTHDAFKSPMELKKKLLEDFADKLPPNLTFEVGYIEKRNNAKRLIEEAADLVTMYQMFKPGSTVTVWCEGKSDEPKSAGSRSDKRKSTHDTETPPAKRTVPRHESHGTATRQTCRIG